MPCAGDDCWGVNIEIIEMSCIVWFHPLTTGVSRRSVPLIIGGGCEPLGTVRLTKCERDVNISDTFVNIADRDVNTPPRREGVAVWRPLKGYRDEEPVGRSVNLGADG